MRAAGRRSNVHGLVELDVTEARRRVDRAAETGERLSFTAFLVHCLAAAIQEHPHVNAYRDWQGRVVTFDEVDVNVLVETTVDGERIWVPHVVRAANRRSLQSIHEEIRASQGDPEVGRQSPQASLAMRLPGVLRGQVWRLPQLFPWRWKRLAGTVAVTSVGMFGTGGGWGISPTNYSLQLTVGGIATKPGYADGDVESGELEVEPGERNVEPREFLPLTVTFDHDVVDGPPAARFVQPLGELIEGCHGLDAESGGG